MIEKKEEYDIKPYIYCGKNEILSKEKTENAKIKLIEGNELKFGNIVSIGNEKFYVLSCKNNYLTLFAMYNLYVGGYEENGKYIPYNEKDATGLQDSKMLGKVENSKEKAEGVINFSDYSARYENSIIKKYIDNYSKYWKSKWQRH